MGKEKEHATMTRVPNSGEARNHPAPGPRAASVDTSPGVGGHENPQPIPHATGTRAAKEEPMGYAGSDLDKELHDLFAERINGLVDFILELRDCTQPAYERSDATNYVLNEVAHYIQQQPWCKLPPICGVPDSEFWTRAHKSHNTPVAACPLCPCSGINSSQRE